MKHDELRSIGHNMADSLACGFVLGQYAGSDVFGEAAKSPSGFITVDFLTGTTPGCKVSPGLAKTVQLCRDGVPLLCAKHRVSVAAFVELTATYQKTRSGQYFVVTVVDRSGRRTQTEYEGFPGRRVRQRDQLGRVRRAPIRRG
jgi:YD repeat-containing protein